MPVEDLENFGEIEFRPYRFLKRKLNHENIPFTQNLDRKGVPFIVVNNEVYVCWVSSRHTQSFKVEWPYSGDLENKTKFKTEDLVIKKIRELVR